jgi:hypothetical protein
MSLKFLSPTMQYPDSKVIHPMQGFPQVCFIKNTVTNPNIIIGDYTYYDDPVAISRFWYVTIRCVKAITIYNEMIY